MSPPVFGAQRHKHGFTSCITVTFSVLRPSNHFRKSLKAFIDTKKKPEGELQMGGSLSQEWTDVQRTSALTSVIYTVSREEVCGPRCPPLLQRSGPRSAKLEWYKTGCSSNMYSYVTKMYNFGKLDGDVPVYYRSTSSLSPYCHSTTEHFCIHSNYEPYQKARFNSGFK